MLYPDCHSDSFFIYRKSSKDFVLKTCTGVHISNSNLGKKKIKEICLKVSIRPRIYLKSTAQISASRYLSRSANLWVTEGCNKNNIHCLSNAMLDKDRHVHSLFLLFCTINHSASQTAYHIYVKLSLVL